MGTMDLRRDRGGYHQRVSSGLAQSEGYFQGCQRLLRGRRVFSCSGRDQFEVLVLNRWG